ncbi:hypothetical protein CGRA01v4_11277 [Colletotrichum graminicola]|nr:hypothetical protein CGRA01v4_11277 [Colletotrichum graminicola]
MMVYHTRYNVGKGSTCGAAQQGNVIHAFPRCFVQSLGSREGLAEGRALEKGCRTVDDSAGLK